MMWMLDVSLPSSVFTGKVEEVILQPPQADMKPWSDVEIKIMNSDSLRQAVANALQTVLDNSPALKSGFAREAAIKTLQTISRIWGILPEALWLQKVTKDAIVTYGGYADVYRGEYNSRMVGLKILKIKGTIDDNNGDKVPKWFRQEVLLWRQLRHPRILQFLGIFPDPVIGEQFYPICLISPWMENGNVRQFLRKNPNSDRSRIALEIIEGIEYLHNHDPQIVHGDIKGANILVTNSGTCCLADFGITMAIETRPPTNSRLGKGSAYWMSPEVWTQIDAHCIPARDIYAFGCTVIEIYSGNKPFPDIPHEHLVYHEVVSNKRKPPRPQQLEEPGTEQLWGIVDSCLVYDAALRPEASLILNRLKPLAS